MTHPRTHLDLRRAKTKGREAVLTTLISNDAYIAQVAAGFIDATLPKAEWTHAAHFAALLWILRHRPELHPEKDMPGLIRAYNTATGTENSDTSGYHETITLASIAVTRAVMAGNDSDQPPHAILHQIMASSLGQSNWLLAHWRRHTLFSVEARRHWVAPDLASLDA